MAIERDLQAAGRRNAAWLAAATAAGTIVLASPELMAFLSKWEEGPKRQLVVYPDKLAGGLPTVCMGLTRHVTATPIVVGERWTEEQCQREERSAVEKLQRELATCFVREPPQSVMDMGTCLGWNNGPEKTCGSGAMRLWNEGKWEEGCRRLSRGEDGRMVWSFTSHIDAKTGQKVYTFRQGLANRRADETGVCLKGLG